MQTPSGKNVIPIFSKRKRPRQALYAHPGSQDTSNASDCQALTSPYNQQSATLQTNTQQYHGRPQYQQPERTPLAATNSNTSRPWNQNSGPNHVKTPGLMNVQYQQSAHPNRSQGQPNMGMHQVNKTQQMGYGRGGPPPNKSLRMNQSTQQNHPSSFPQKQPQKNYQFPQRNNATQPSGSGFSHRQPPATMQPAYSPSTPRRDVPHTATSSTPTGPGATAPSPLSSGNRQTPFRMPVTPSTPLRQSQASGAFWEVRDPKNDGSKADTSMKILTVGIEELRYWTASKDIHGLVFFEIFGILNSAVCSDEGGISKKFTIKDGNHVLQCIFYETDRPISHVTRGQYVRCMGSILPKKGVFRCVSVRPATPAEQKVMRNMVAACDKAVREKVHATGIEP